MSAVGRSARPALAIFLGLTILTGVIYPVVVTAIGALLFPRAAGGSLTEVNGRTVGSTLVGQPFHSPKYFWGRPSATAPQYNASSSSGSNQGPTNPALRDAVANRVASLRAAHPGTSAAVPVDLVTTSASGLDPDITPAAALWQVGRVARARQLDSATVAALVVRTISERTFGILGERRVNVLRLNLALDSLAMRR
jgi:K+-transporting ATPase ATPase C chain